MITFYLDSFRTLAAWAWHARIWMHTHPVRARIFIVLLLVAYLTVIQSQAAHAAGFLPDGVDFVDNRGNKFSQYSVINIDPGDVWNPGKVMVNFVVQMLWSIQYFMTGVVIWLFGFLLSFEWVAWLATPFNTLAVWVQDQLTAFNWIPFALMISAVAGGIAIFLGRTAGGLMEMFVAVVISVLALGVLANPVATLTATNGMLDSAQTFGGELAASIVVDPDMVGQTQETMSAAVTSQLMDIFVRVPYQVISYSMVLPAECQGIFDTFIQSGEPQPALRDCSPAAAVFSFDNPSGVNIMNAMVNGAGVTVLLVFGMAIATLLIVAVFFFLVAAIKSMIFAYLAILPINRAPLWKAISDSFMGLISMVVMTVCLALYLKLITWLMTQTGGLPHQLRMVLIVIFLIVIIFLIWRARRATMLAGRDVANKISHLGLGMKPGTKDSNALLKMSAVTAMAKTGYDLFKRSPNKASAVAATASKAPVEVAEPIDLIASRIPGRRSSSASGSSSAAATGLKALGAAIPSKGAPSSTGAAMPSKGAHPSPAGKPRVVPKAIGAAATVVTVAKGAAAGGVGGAVAAGATVVVKSAGTKAAGAAVAKATSGGTPKAPPVDGGELKVVKVHESAPPSRIEVDSKGVATARRRPAPMVYDISSMHPRTPPTSPRALERRRELEAFRPRDLSSR